MSDYLWDKTGEPDEDVEQLEKLLGALKYQPRPLEIPATVMPLRSRPATTFFSRPRLAIAASLLLMLLAGAWLATRQGDQQPNRIATINREGSTDGNNQPQPTATAKTETGSNDSLKVADKGRDDEKVIIQTATLNRRPVRKLSAKRQKQQVQPFVKEDAAVPQHEEVAFTEAEGREATEKLMLALRLASAKLNFAQRELQEINRVEK